VAGFTVDTLGCGCAGKFVSRVAVFFEHLCGGQVDAQHFSLLFTSELLAKEH
jgi:hypothetical protein